MGMAASQCRILLLTARKSDLELRAQNITQRKMVLSMQTEEVASAYTTALGNREINFVWNMDSSDNTQQKQLLTYKALCNSTNNGTAQNARIVNASGAIVVRDASDPVLQKMLTTTVFDEATNTNKTVQFGNIDANGYIINVQNSYGLTCPDVGKRIIYAGTLIDNTDLFQNALRQGTLLMQTGTSSDLVDAEGTALQSSGVINWTNFAWEANESFSDDLYTEDDNLALARYETEMSKIQALDKALDVELSQVETQQKACQNELESVEKVLEKNVESSFKTFS